MHLTFLTVFCNLHFLSRMILHFYQCHQMPTLYASCLLFRLFFFHFLFWMLFVVFWFSILWLLLFLIEFMTMMMSAVFCSFICQFNWSKTNIEFLWTCIILILEKYENARKSFWNLVFEKASMPIFTCCTMLLQLISSA